MSTVCLPNGIVLVDVISVFVMREFTSVTILLKCTVSKLLRALNC